MDSDDFISEFLIILVTLTRKRLEAFDKAFLTRSHISPWKGLIAMHLKSHSFADLATQCHLSVYTFLQVAESTYS